MYIVVTLENLSNYIQIEFDGKGSYKILRNTLKKLNVEISENGIITLKTSKLMQIYSKSYIGTKAYGFGIYAEQHTTKEYLMAFVSKRAEDIAELNCIYWGSAIRINHILMSSAEAALNGNMNYSQGECALTLKADTLVTILFLD